MAESKTSMDLGTAYPTVFKFLDQNFGHSKYKRKWKALIHGDILASEYLSDALEELREKEDEENLIYVPDRNNILKALTYTQPRDVKAIIVAHDPEIEREQASGLAFSFPEDYDTSKLQKVLEKYWKETATYDLSKLNEFLYCKRDSSKEIVKRPKGYAMVVFKIALLRAGVETDKDIQKFCYEDWANKGVLLMNSALTVEEGVSSRSKKHKFWLKFTARLLFLVLRESQHKPVFGMFWGDFAEKVLSRIERYCEFEEDAENYPTDCHHYSHPTYPRDPDQNTFMINAPKHFQKLDTKVGLSDRPNGNDDIDDLTGKAKHFQVKD